ncbi:hypothetical protein IU433_00855 [Nocardia puris]|uniref:hypothetical protein n=1 Tax=Nocardia puris TaxID=208602 RepID=UPI001893C415|nr:hypothetical protein [Nocardia puris]MBF6210332.1 hypothetical protein [Nocardia puris]MBF6367407.1 hypothetical protein [Nocardia puris]MBF6457592.1 hypothetical protein [Nocardia puris]
MFQFVQSNRPRSDATPGPSKKSSATGRPVAVETPVGWRALAGRRHEIEREIGALEWRCALLDGAVARPGQGIGWPCWRRSWTAPARATPWCASGAAPSARGVTDLPALRGRLLAASAHDDPCFDRYWALTAEAGMVETAGPAHRWLYDALRVSG